MEKKQKLEKLTKVAKIFYLEVQKLLRISDFGSRVADQVAVIFKNLRLGGVKNQVAYEKMCNLYPHIATVRFRINSNNSSNASTRKCSINTSEDNMDPHMLRREVWLTV